MADSGLEGLVDAADEGLGGGAAAREVEVGAELPAHAHDGARSEDVGVAQIPSNSGYRSRAPRSSSTIDDRIRRARTAARSALTLK